MRLTIAGCYLLYAVAAFAQADRGTITGTVSDPAGAVVPNAAIEARNQETGVIFKGGSSTTGNYTLAQIPVGVYELSVSVTGFKKFVRPGITIHVAETVRVDATLEVGQTSETITVNEEAPLLKTESGEISHQIEYSAANELPLFTTNGTGGSTGLGNIRDPLTVLNLLPGASQTTDSVLRVNGLPSSSQTIMVEGMDATNGMWRQQNQNTQQGTDAVQEVSVQTSNFAAEYGGAGGGYLNFTMKSGTNQFHGSGYDYFVNSALNAGLPFSANCNQENNCATNINSGHIKNSVKRNDYGFTFGGPVWIPKVYNGKDKTFFFFNFEQFRQSTVTNNGIATMPVAAYETGDFSSALAPYLAGVNGPQPITIIPNQIFDPKTRTIVNGSPVESPFANNMIPISRLDPVALYLQSFFPKANLAGALNNYAIPAYSNFLHTTIPSVKVDQALSSTMKLSGYFSLTEQNSPNNNGFASDLAPVAPNADRSYTYRINFDDTIKPTLLLHFGIGLLYYDHPVFTTTSNFTSQAATAASNGYGGGAGGYSYSPFPASQYMPSFSGLNNAIVGGGLALGSGFFAPSPGPGGFDESRLKDIKPTGNASVTWVHGNHTFKGGYSLVLEGFPQQSSIRAFGGLTFSGQQTENPAEYGLPSAPIFPSGFAYASFLLGQLSQVQTSGINDTRLGNHNMGAFFQDSWKVNRKLTLELGLRWDYATLLSEQYGRMSDACFTCVNTSLASAYSPGGLAGGIVYGATNNGPLTHAYPFSFGPRLGVAYQITPKTVFRAGGAMAYSSPADNAFLSYSVANFYNVQSPGQFLPAGQLANGDPLHGSPLETFPYYNQYPFPVSQTGCGLTGGLPCVPPQEPFITIARSSRLPRIFQWSIGFQREVIPNLLFEANYVGNRGAWFTAPLRDTQSFNGLTQQILSNLTTEGPGGTGKYGATQNMNFQNASDFNLLNEQINSPAVIARFPALANPSNVYPGFPSTSTLAQALRPYPQWYGVPNFLGPPMGDTWYDSLQIKVTKRYSHGLTATGAYTWEKGLTNGSGANTSYLVPQGGDVVLNDPYNVGTDKQLNGFDQPQTLVISFSYTTPKLSKNFLGDNAGSKAVSWLARDWTIGGVLRYASGVLLQSPAANNNLWNTMGLGGTPLNGVSNFGGTNTLENYVPGQSCLAINPNSHFDPTTTLALNAARWTQPGVGQFGDAGPYYSNCRWQRQPAESLSLGRVFRIKEKYQILIQGQFFNVFNRVFYPAPTASTTSTTAATYSNPFPGSAAPTGALNGGYGFVNTLNGTGTNPRSGQLVARFTF
jgi:Carboxypeptidase regulatory-like domain